MDDSASLARAELAACLHRIAGGDRFALEELYKRTAAKLFGICKRILPDGRQAEDVLQEVYVTVWNKAGRFDAARGTSPVTWLAVLARNRALDRLRATRQRFTALDDAFDIADPGPLADAVMAQAESRQRLQACLGALEPRAASAINAAFFGGQTYQTLAERAEMPLGSMKSIIRRALLQLRLCLNDD